MFSLCILPRSTHSTNHLSIEIPNPRRQSQYHSKSNRKAWYNITRMIKGGTDLMSPLLCTHTQIGNVDRLAKTGFRGRIENRIERDVLEYFVDTKFVGVDHRHGYCYCYCYYYWWRWYCCCCLDRRLAVRTGRGGLWSKVSAGGNWEWTAFASGFPSILRFEVWHHHKYFFFLDLSFLQDPWF